jgi:hypothetical protein
MIKPLIKRAIMKHPGARAVLFTNVLLLFPASILHQQLDEFQYRIMYRLDGAAVVEKAIVL